MDFSTLQQHNGNYVTPLFEEKFEDVVWSVDATWQGTTQRVYLYILLEFQSTVDQRMPLRMMHYVACFHDHLIKNGITTAKQGLPPVFPLVLYNGAKRWTAVQDVYDMITPQPPGFLQAYQPHFRYYLVEEQCYSDNDLAERNTPLSGVFGIENASGGYEALQAAIDRMLESVQSHPNKARMDEVTTRWFKRHLRRLGTQVDVGELNSLLTSSPPFALTRLRKRIPFRVPTDRSVGRFLLLAVLLPRSLHRRFGRRPALEVLLIRGFKKVEASVKHVDGADDIGIFGVSAVNAQKLRLRLAVVR